MHVNAEKTMFATDASQSKWTLVESVSARDLEELSKSKVHMVEPLRSTWIFAFVETSKSKLQS